MGWNDVNTNESSKEARDFVKFVEGTNTVIRIVDAEPFSRWTHWMPQYKRSITCLGRGCPICNLVQQAKANDETPKYSQSKRHAIRVLNRNTGNVEILDQGRKFFNQLLSFHTEIGDTRNYDIKVIRVGSDKSTDYTLIPLPAKELTEEENNLINENAIDFAEYFKAPSMEQALQMVEGVALEEIFVNTSEEFKTE